MDPNGLSDPYVKVRWENWINNFSVCWVIVSGQDDPGEWLWMSEEENEDYQAVSKSSLEWDYKNV